MYRGAIENIALLIILGTNPRIGIIWWRIFGIANPEMQIRVHKCLRTRNSFVMELIILTQSDSLSYPIGCDAYLCPSIDFVSIFYMLYRDLDMFDQLNLQVE